MKLIHRSTLISEKEIQESIQKLPKDCLELKVKVRIIEKPEQLFTLGNVFKKKTWSDYQGLLNSSKEHGFYDPINKEVVIITGNIQKSIENTVHFLKDEYEIEIYKQTLKPQIILALYHEFRHAHQDIIGKKPFDHTSEYHKRWQEIDAHFVSEYNFNKNQKELQPILSLPFACTFHYGREIEKMEIKIKTKENREFSFELKFKREKVA